MERALLSQGVRNWKMEKKIMHRYTAVSRTSALVDATYEKGT